MRLWRIAAETRAYPAHDLSGNGAARFPGRWNEAGEPVLYCAPTLAVAVLETAAHIGDGGLPLNRFVIAIDVPEQVWAQHERIEPDDLPPAWRAMPAGQASVRIGSAWLLSQRSPILLLPSAIVPEEQVALVNPLHPASLTIRAQVIRSFDYRVLFRSG